MLSTNGGVHCVRRYVLYWSDCCVYRAVIQVAVVKLNLFKSITESCECSVNGDDFVTVFCSWAHHRELQHSLLFMQIAS